MLTQTPSDVLSALKLDGSLTTEGFSNSFTQDFGRLQTTEPWAVLHPESIEDIARVVSFAAGAGLAVAFNGQSGHDDHRESHSLSGQALASGGVVIDAKTLSTIHEIGDGYAVVDPGVHWSALVKAAVQTGQAPPVLPDYPYLSIGGTLSVGGMGATSHRYGSQADNVESLTVVTGTGEIVDCSRSDRRDLFDAVLAGAGQFGLITRARVRLIPAPTSVQFAKIALPDGKTFEQNALAVMASTKVDDINAGIFPGPNGTWQFALLAALYDAPPESPIIDSLLSPGAKVIERHEMSYLDWIFRLDPMWAKLQQAGHWDQPKPRLTVFVSASEALALAESVLTELIPSDLGAGSVRLSPLNATPISQPSLMLPVEQGPFFEFSVGRFPEPGHLDIDGLMTQNRTIYDRAVAVGAKRYMYSAIPDMSEKDWSLHYGDRWETLTALKKKYDPNKILTPGMEIF